MSSNISDTQCMKAIYLVMGGLFAVFIALVFIARMITGA